MSLVRANTICHGEQMYALESNTTKKSYDGQCGKCSDHHIQFKNPNRGFYSSVSRHSRYDSLETKKQRNVQKVQRESMNYQENNVLCHHFENQYLAKIKASKATQIHVIWTQPSSVCSLIAMCSILYYIRMLTIKNQSKIYKNYSEKILSAYFAAKQVSSNVSLIRMPLFPIKMTLMTIGDALFHLRALLSKATGDASFKEMEKDPSEFLRALEDLFHCAPIKTIPPNQPFNSVGYNATTNIICKRCSPLFSTQFINVSLIFS